MNEGSKFRDKSPTNSNSVSIIKIKQEQNNYLPYPFGKNNKKPGKQEVLKYLLFIH